MNRNRGFSLKKLVASFGAVDRIYRFNRVERHRWVTTVAASLPRGATVLDVGAGTAPHRSSFAHCVYKTHDFGKLEPHQLQDGEAYCTPDYSSDILEIPVEPSSFDAILCTEVLEHVPEPIKAIHEFARILKPRGRLLLTAPQGSGIHQEPYHFYGGYTPYWYRRFLDQAGFVDIHVQPNGGSFKFVGQEMLRASITLARALANPRKWLLAPVYALCLILLVAPALILPLFGDVLDRLDPDSMFTVGYFVSATKKFD